MASTTIQIRVDEKLKREAQKVYRAIGLDTSSAVKLFMQQSVNTQSLPLPEIKCPFPNHTIPPKKLAQYEREAKWAIKHGKRYTNVDQMFRDILGK